MTEERQPENWIEISVDDPKTQRIIADAYAKAEVQPSQEQQLCPMCQKPRIMDMPAELVQLREKLLAQTEAARELLKFIQHTKDCNITIKHAVKISRLTWKDSPCNCGLEAAAEKLRSAMEGK